LSATERPEWLPSNFKSPEDLARSYTESQRKIHELAGEKSELLRVIGEISQENEELREALTAVVQDRVNLTAQAERLAATIQTKETILQ
jgi:predicted nuclease with TOPRIM domain